MTAPQDSVSVSLHASERTAVAADLVSVFRTMDGRMINKTFKE